MNSITRRLRRHSSRALTVRIPQPVRPNLQRELTSSATRNLPR